MLEKYFSFDGAPEFVAGLLRSSAAVAITGLCVWAILRHTRSDSPAMRRFLAVLVVMQGWIFFRMNADVPWRDPPRAAAITRRPARTEGQKDSEPDNLATLHDPDVHTSTTESEPEKSLPGKGDIAADTTPVSSIALPPVSGTADVIQFAAPPSSRWWSVMAVTWFCGCLCTVVMALILYTRLWQTLRRVRRVGLREVPEWDAALAACHVLPKAGVSLCFTDGIGPSVVQFPRETVVLVPRKVWDGLRAAERCAVLRHELAHVERGDLWKSCLVRLMAVPHWFNPCAWWAVGTFDDAAEWACDQAALDAGLAPRDYSYLLLGLSSSRSGYPVHAMGAAANRLAARIRRLVEPSKGSQSAVKKALLAVTVVLLVAANGLNVRLVERAVVAEADASEPAAAPSLSGGVNEKPQTNSVAIAADASAQQGAKYDPIAEAAQANSALGVRAQDYPQFGLSQFRNNVSAARSIPTAWDVKSGDGVKWSARLGTQTYSSPVVANGKLFVGTNNGAAYVKRFPEVVELGVLLCFDAETGRFLWQHSNEKLPKLRPNARAQADVWSCAYIEGDRLWYVNNRDELCCLDTEGFRDNENDGPFKEEPNQNQDEADVVWKFDMIGQLGAWPHRHSCCSVTALGDTLLVCTSNEDNPDAPSFLAMNKKTGELLWSDKSPGSNILNAQWSSPACGVLGGVAQAIFAGGDGWLYSFDPQGEAGKAKLLWKFDCNPKESHYMLERATRLSLIATPVIYDGRVYIGVGEDPERGEGPGRLWCVDPTRRGDVSPTIVYNKSAPETPIAHKRLQALVASKGDFELPNPNSAAVWTYVGSDAGKFLGTMHRTISNVAIADDLLFIADECGLIHCVDAKSGKGHWTHDMLATCWSTPLIVRDCVYITNLDGGVFIFKVSAEKELVRELSMEIPVYSTPVVANGTMFVATFKILYAIQAGAMHKAVGK